MEFDLFTFGASLFNFIVLLVLLRIFLFERVTKAMEERQRRIAESWDEAERKQHDADGIRANYEQRMEEIDEERDKLLRQAKEEMERQKGARLDEVRVEMEEKRMEWMQELEREQQRLLESIRSEVAHAAIESTRAVLLALAGAKLEQRMIDRLLEEIDSHKNAELIDQLQAAEVEVTTSTELDEDDRERITSALREVAEPASVSFRESDDLGCGVRMRIGDLEIGWSIADRLSDLEGEVSRLVEARGT
jgi:F-type H+-transporting ATPase subunit b